jgi:CRISPR-associated protein Cas1
MKKMKNSLYVTTQRSYLHKERETIVLEVEQKKIRQFPAHAISDIFCFGNVLVSPFLSGFCSEQGINLVHFTEYGSFLGQWNGMQTGNVLLRRAQHRKSELAPVPIAQAIIAAKITSSRRILQRRLRNHGSHPKVEQTIQSLGNSLQQLKAAKNLDFIRGIEGEAAARYFSVFQYLISEGLHQTFKFNGRNRRPPRDPVNAMLSFLYIILGKQISGALQSVGLDPQMGFLHADRPGRDSLAQDLLEEFRAWWIDRLVLSLINRKQVGVQDFLVEASGAVTMKDETRKTLLKAFQDKKQEKILHPYLEEEVSIGLLPHIQAQLLARHLRGDLEYYPPFVIR